MIRFSWFSVWFYMVIATLFTYFAIDHVRYVGWDWIALLYVALAAYDFKVAFTGIYVYFKLRKMMPKK
ncbi:MAG: DUF4305 domain-containing protein [Bacilli bacterium]